MPSLGLNHLTAWRTVFAKAKLQHGETVLVFGAEQSPRSKWTMLWQ
jgi:NADPH:quinone reductase-like Zn-dependent oxidoreductase